MKKSFICGTEFKNFKETEEQGQKFGFFEGFGAVFNDKDHSDDVIIKGAFAESLKSNRKVKLLFQHDSNEIIGSVVEMSEIDTGLLVKGRVNLETSRGREVYALLKAGDLDSMSIGYRTKECEIDRDNQVRVLKEIDLFEISLVVFPANEKALVTSVKKISSAESLSDIESILKEKGFSGKQAKTVVAKIKEISQREVAESKKEADQRDVEYSANLQSIIGELEKTTNTLKG